MPADCTLLAKIAKRSGTPWRANRLSGCVLLCSRDPVVVVELGRICSGFRRVAERRFMLPIFTGERAYPWFSRLQGVASHQVTFATEKVTTRSERIELAGRSAAVRDLREAGQPARRLRRRPRRLRAHPAGPAHDQRAAVEGLGPEAPHQRPRHEPRFGIVPGGGTGHRPRAGAGQPPQDRVGRRPAHRREPDPDSRRCAGGRDQGPLGVVEERRTLRGDLARVCQLFRVWGGQRGRGGGVFPLHRRLGALLGWSGDVGFVPVAGVGSDGGEGSGLEGCAAGGERDSAAVGVEVV